MRVKKEMHPFDDLYDLIKGKGKIDFEINNETDAYNKSVWVSRCINIIALKIATIPHQVMINDKQVNTKLESIINRPSAQHTYSTFIRNIVSWCKLKGFVIVVDEFPQMRIIDSDKIINIAGTLFEISLTGKRVPIDMERSAIIRNFSLQNGVIGMPEIYSLMPTLQYQSLLEQASKNVLKNGGITPYVLSTQQPMNEGMLDKIMRMWKEKFSGIENAGETPILPNGLTVQNVGLSPIDMGILQQEGISKNRIATLFGVPTIYLNDTEHVDYATSEIQMRIFAYNTIIPEAQHWTEQINKILLPMVCKNNGIQPGNLVLKTSELYELQEDGQKKTAVDVQKVLNGIVTINELRVRDGLNPVAWGNVWWRSYGLTDGSESIIDNTTTEKTIKKSEMDRETMWKLYIARTFSQEKKMASEMKKFFARIEKDVIANLEKSIQNIETKTYDSESYKQILIKTLKPLYYAFGSQAIENTKNDYGLTVDFTVGNPDYAVYTEQTIKEVASEIMQTTDENLEKILKEGIAEGKPVAEIGKDLQNYFDFAKTSRAQLISRTEVNAINTHAMQETAKAGGLTEKGWSSALDEKTRPDHLMADNQYVGISEDFRVGKDSMAGPGDPKAPVGQRANCRCTLTFR